MRVVRTAQGMVHLAAQLRRTGKTIGFVPTMGALHEGHLSLIRAAARSTDVVVISIFVNPLQFGRGDDLGRYPRPLARDLHLARRAGAAVVFVPAARELYPAGFDTAVETGAVARRWEGAARPGHFRGVATVVAVLLELVRPTAAFFGQKDYQQVLVVRQLVRDLRLPVSIRMRPTVREPGGLAMSSRNAYLTGAQRRQAAVLYRALRGARAAIRAGERSAARVAQGMRGVMVRERGVAVEYAAAVDAATLAPRARLRGRTALLVAARVGRTRLIDNLLVGVA